MFPFTAPSAWYGFVGIHQNGVVFHLPDQVVGLSCLE